MPKLADKLLRLLPENYATRSAGIFSGSHLADATVWVWHGNIKTWQAKMSHCDIICNACAPKPIDAIDFTTDAEVIHDIPRFYQVAMQAVSFKISSRYRLDCLLGKCGNCGAAHWSASGVRFSVDVPRGTVFPNWR